VVGGEGGREGGRDVRHEHFQLDFLALPVLIERFHLLQRCLQLLVQSTGRQDAFFQEVGESTEGGREGGRED
jgi:hypothetical protein